jgi:hypothetical protein
MPAVAVVDLTSEVMMVEVRAVVAGAGAVAMGVTVVPGATEVRAAETTVVLEARVA